MIIFTSAYLTAQAGTPYPLKNPRIGYQSYPRDLALTAAAITVSSETTDTPRDAPLTEDTAAVWQGTAYPATWKLDMGSGKDVDYVGVAGHSIGTCGASLKVETSNDNSVWTLFA